MRNPINANAVYLAILMTDAKTLLIDMNDIARVGLSQEKMNLQAQDKEYKGYYQCLIDFKTPFSEQMQGFINDDEVKRWQNFVKKPAKTVDK